jgi:hypothetical protein
MSEQFGVRLSAELAKLMREAYVHLSDAERHEISDAAQAGAAVGSVVAGSPGGMIASGWAGNIGVNGWRHGRLTAIKLLMTPYEYWETRCVANTAQEIDSAIEHTAKIKLATRLPLQATWLPDATYLYYAPFQLEAHHRRDPVLLAIKDEPARPGSIRLTISAVSYEARFWKRKTFRRARHVLRAFVDELDSRLRETPCD